MAGSESSGEDKPTSITPAMLLRVAHDKGTPQERELILQAFADPHSELHDWLEGVEEWAERNFGGRTPSGRAADAMATDAIARQHRQDVVTFLRRKHGEGIISEEALSKILAAGAPESDVTPLTSEEAAKATAKMIQLAALLHPAIAPELARLSTGRGQDAKDPGRP